jgi:hypothetical protein
MNVEQFSLRYSQVLYPPSMLLFALNPSVSNPSMLIFIWKAANLSKGQLI